MALATAKRQASPMKLFMIFENGCLFVEIETRYDVLEQNRATFIRKGVLIQKKRTLEDTGECCHRSQLGIGRDCGTKEGVGGQCPPPHILADQLTLFQQGKQAINPHAYLPSKIFRASAIPDLYSHLEAPEEGDFQVHKYSEFPV